MGLLAQWARPRGSQSGGAIGAVAPLVAGTVLAEAAVYAFGVPWLAVAYAGGSLGRAIAVGLVPYLLGDALKMAVAVGAVRIGARALGRWGALPF